MINSNLTISAPKSVSKPYLITITSNLIYELTQYLLNHYANHKIVIITDEIVNNLYIKHFEEQFLKSDLSFHIIKFKAGEINKSQATKTFIEERMLELQLKRDTVCVALGGGIVGDMAGFVASTYMRGIDYINIPTTLLAMVDSSIGGKTAINTPYGKNLIGTFWPPSAVMIDLNFLQTLPNEHLINGLVEVIKIFLTFDKSLFEYLQVNLEKILNKDKDTIRYLIYNALKLKAQVVEQDSNDISLRKILNFGHTIGHAIEAISNYEILHGYAVGVGILVEAKIAVYLNYLSNKEYVIIKNLLNSLGINLSLINKYAIDQIINYCELDKKNLNDSIYFIILQKIGATLLSSQQVAHLVEKEVIIKALQSSNSE